ncbi:hypothetical protein Esti_003232 [Eimeria stiedai]
MEEGLEDSAYSAVDGAAAAPSDRIFLESGREDSPWPSSGAPGGVFGGRASRGSASFSSSSTDRASGNQLQSRRASAHRDHAHPTAAEAAQPSSGASAASVGAHAGSHPAVPQLLRSSSAEPVRVPRQHSHKMGVDQSAASRGDPNASDYQRPMSSRPDTRRTERMSSFLALDKHFTTRVVQTSAPPAPPVAAACTRHPSLRSFSHLPPFDRFVVPEDSFTEKCGRGALIGEFLLTTRIAAGSTRPPRPGSTSSGKYERLPPHIRALMNFRQEVIHPAVLRVGLQMGQRKIVGANARTAAMLTAFQRFIEDYSPPPYQAIDKHLKQMLDRQINFITHCRPHSIAMGGTIRWLKRRLSSYAALQLEETRSRLSLDISNFIAGRLLSATWTAASIVEQQLIENGDNVMVFGRSTAINCALLQSKKQGLQFSVVMVDAPHSVSGQATAKEFADAGIYVTYTMLNGLSYHIRGITKVLLGCAALLANGYVVNSAGAATVAMMGKVHAKPVLVVTETYKMSDRVMLDSCSFNELADPALVWRPPCGEEAGGAGAFPPSSSGQRSTAATAPPGCPPSAAASGGEAWDAAGFGGELGGGGVGGGWERQQQEQQQHPRCAYCQSEFQVPVVNPTYDVTPAQFIDYVVTEDGVFPASSIPSLICGLGKSPALAD